MHRQRLLEMLQAYQARFPVEARVVQRFAGFVDSEPRCYERDCWTGHVTGSAWVLDPECCEALLTHHKKLGRWLQLGGHSDGDGDTLAVAIREAHEESGVAIRVLADDIFDIDIHEIPARGGEPAHFHFDVRFLLAATSRKFVVSAESHELAWVPIADMATYTDEESVLRMARKSAQLGFGGRGAKGDGSE